MHPVRRKELSEVREQSAIIPNLEMSITDLEIGNYEKETIIASLEQVVTDLEISDIEKTISITELEENVQTLMTGGNE